MNKKTIGKRLRLTSKTGLMVATALLLLTGGAWALTHKNTTQEITTKPTTVSTATSSEKQTSPSASSSASSNSQPGSGSSTNDKSSGGALKSPTGQFVSNHHPGANGSPTAEQSVCNTLPDASCYIKFTNGNNTKVLPTKTADNNGAVFWLWDVKDPNNSFAAGTWRITAVATYNGQTESSSDSITLEVLP